MAPPSSLLLFLVSSVWVALSPQLMVPAAAADGQGGEHCAPKLCGNVTISFPFGLVQVDAQPNTTCGAEIGFQVHCGSDNTIPYLGYYQSEFGMRILNIFYHNRSLLIAKTTTDKGENYFNTSSVPGVDCRIPAANTSSRLVAPFSISPVNQNLIFYNCTKPLSPGEGLLETICRENTYVRVAGERSSDGDDSYSMEGCNASFVPVLGWSVRTEAINYEQLIREGFLVR